MICDSMTREPDELERTLLAAREAVAGLSAFETDVLNGIVEGGSSADIAASLGVETEEINNARGAMMAKLGASATADLVRTAIYANYTRPD